MTVRQFLKSHDFSKFKYDEIHIYDRGGRPVTYDESKNEDVRDYMFYKDNKIEKHPTMLLITLRRFLDI